MRFEKPNENAGMENHFRKWCSYQPQEFSICDKLKWFALCAFGAYD
jgi:hypothetical protein